MKVLVTGAAGSIGRVVTVGLADRGHAVVGLDRVPQPDGGEGPWYTLDAADPDAVACSVRAATEYPGGLDVLVNNAGVGVTARLTDTPVADYDQVMNVNVRGYLLYAQHAYPHLAARRGCMIHIASDAGIWGTWTGQVASLAGNSLLRASRTPPTRGTLPCRPGWVLTVPAPQTNVPDGRPKPMAEQGSPLIR